MFSCANSQVNPFVRQTHDHRAATRQRCITFPRLIALPVNEIARDGLYGACTLSQAMRGGGKQR